MKKLIVVAACLLLVPVFMAAKEARQKPVISAKDCSYLTAHQPSPDVEYQPGVDVQGKPVVEADLAPSVIQPPEKYSFRLVVDVAEYIGLTAPAGVEGKTEIGTITVEDGKIKFNGKPLEGDAEAALIALCASLPLSPRRSGGP